jgi:hypothetical protein
MKIDIDTIIYLIITLIFVALGAAGKRKKTGVKTGKQVPEPKPDVMDEEAPADIFTQNFRRFMGEFDSEDTHEDIQDGQEADAEVVEADFNAKEEKLDSHTSLLDTVSDAIERLEKQSGYDNNEDSIKMSELTSEHMQRAHRDEIQRMLDNFNIQKAIIYSEILEPKYF